MKFIIPVTYTMRGSYTLEAETLELAIEKVYAAENECEGLPRNSDYVDDSMEVIKDDIIAY